MMERQRRGNRWQRSTFGLALVLGLGAGAGNVAFAQSTPTSFVLSGVVIDAQGTARAIVEDPQWTGGRSVMLRVGDQIGPYRVVSIAADHAVLQGPGEPLRLRLSGVAAAGPATALAPSSGPALGGPAGVPFQKPTALPPEVVAKTPPAPTEDELKKFLTPTPPGVYRHSSEGVSAPVTSFPAVDVDDFKRQVKEHMLHIPVR